MKKLISIHRQGEGHWVGDGFPVHTIFHYGDRPELSPFLLLDHAGPADFPPAQKARGVEWHPHRGFETVTVIFEGEVDHQDTAGNGGRIGPGDVQWMTAGAGLLHKEMHSADFAKHGGRFEVLQLWVNLPAKNKMTPPRYQTLAAADIPVAALPGGASVRVIAGEHAGVRGPAATFSPVTVLDVRLEPGSRAHLALAEGHTAALYVLKGRVKVNTSRAEIEEVQATELAIFDRTGSGIELEASENAMVLVISGEPIAEPVFGHGPFVMNTVQEVQQAYLDLRHGRMGRIPEAAAP